MKSVVTLIFIGFFVIDSKAQLMSSKVFYPGVKSIKEKYFNGSGGHGYWILKQCDSLGRNIVQENFKNNQLLAKSIFKYNSNNDQTLKINIFDINHPQKIDSSSTNYKYIQSGIIIGQSSTFPNGSFVIYELSKNVGDSILEYKWSSPNSTYYYTLFRSKKGVVYKTILESQDRSEAKITYFDYYKNGNLMSKRMESIRKPEFETIYMGGPGGDDMTYKYKYYRNGSTKTEYCVVKGKKYKLATYQYTFK